MNNMKVLLNGIIKENPTFVLLLGMCPTLGTTSSAFNGMSMGLATTAVLIFSNLIISLIKNIIPDMVRIPSFIVVIASLVTILQMLLQAYVPAVYESLGLFIPLIVVNCIILGRAEAFASKHSPVSSIFDGIGMGLGFTIALTLLGATRELLDNLRRYEFDAIGFATADTHAHVIGTAGNLYLLAHLDGKGLAIYLQVELIAVVGRHCVFRPQFGQRLAHDNPALVDLVVFKGRGGYFGATVYMAIINVNVTCC